MDSRILREESRASKIKKSKLQRSKTTISGSKSTLPQSVSPALATNCERVKACVQVCICLTDSSTRKYKIHVLCYSRGGGGANYPLNAAMESMSTAHYTMLYMLGCLPLNIVN